MLRKRDDGCQPVVLKYPAPTFALSVTGPAGEARRGVRNTAAGCVLIPFCQHVLQEEIGDARVAGTEAGIVAKHFVLAADDVLDSLPFRAEQRAGEYEAETLAGMPIFAADWIAAALAMA
jgi:hypothetical protein